MSLRCACRRVSLPLVIVLYSLLHGAFRRYPSGAEGLLEADLSRHTDPAVLWSDSQASADGIYGPDRHPADPAPSIPVFASCRTMPAPGLLLGIQLLGIMQPTWYRHTNWNGTFRTSTRIVLQPFPCSS
jgi:hypothetical protein